MSAYDGNGNQRSLLVPSTDGWDDAAKDASDRLIQGQILLFADWRYTAGKERVPVALGRRLIARSTLHYWRRWEGGKIVQHTCVKPARNCRSAMRSVTTIQTNGTSALMANRKILGRRPDRSCSRIRVRPSSTPS